MKILRSILFSISLLGLNIHAQWPSTGDCDGAIPLLGFYDMPTPLVPANNIPNEINTLTSCLSIGELNGYWFKFMIVDSGILSFNIIPQSPTDDYDFALYELTSATCADIFLIDSLEIRCNYSNSVSNGGITGANNGLNNQDEPSVPVLPGQIFKLFVSNFSFSLNGFRVDLGASTCTFNQAIGMENYQVKNRIKLAPNPTDGPINIMIDNGLMGSIQVIKIRDVHGKTIFEKSDGFASLLSFDLSNEPVGLYFLEISTWAERHFFKLLVE